MLPEWVSLCCTVLLVLCGVHANPKASSAKTTLQFSAVIGAVGFSNLADKDRARVKALTQSSHLDERTTRSVSAVGTNAALFYATEVGIGTPPTYYTLMIDTGSSNTWVGANKRYVPTSSSVNTMGIVHVIYGSGAFIGEEWLDTVTLAPGLVIDQQSIGVANWTTGIDGIDGILGLGPVDLTTGSTSNALQVSTVMDNLYKERTTSQEALGIFFPPTSNSDDSGELTFGGYDDSKITSSVNYVPLTTTFPASQYWGIDQSISYGNVTILASTAGIVDTGTTLVLIATHAFEKYKFLTNATLDATTGLLTITPSQYSHLQTLSFNIGDNSYDLTPNAQIWPRSLNSAIGGNSSSIYLVVNDIGLPDGLYFSFVNGYSFLERYYSIFDTSYQRFGIAETKYTYAETN